MEMAEVESIVTGCDGLTDFRSLRLLRLSAVKAHRQRTRWRRTVEESKKHQLCCSTVEKTAKDRLEWRNLVAALCANVRCGDE